MYRKKKKRSFNADLIKTQISQAVNLDLMDLYSEVHTSAQFGITEQCAELCKKYVSPTANTSALEDSTFQSFEKLNERMAYINIMFNNKPFTKQSDYHLTDTDLMLLKARFIVHEMVGVFDYEEMFNYAKHSSGTSLGVPYKDTSPERKNLFPLSSTKDAAPLLGMYLRYNFPFRYALRSTNEHRYSDKILDIVAGSRSTTVDKTTTKRRMIAIEPTLNMFFQQGLMASLTKRFERYSKTSLSTLPDDHKRLAREGSLDGQLSTIDFSSASDCVSIGLVRYLFPSDWVRMLERLRSPSTTLNGKVVRLSMISTMGNATTFPLETICFWALALAAQSPSRSRSLFPNKEDKKNVSVFGDDCIVPTKSALTFIGLCEYCGFIVNKEKSFFDSDSRFRESCGGDFLNGFPVRPYFMSAPTTCSLSSLEPWLYINMNRLNLQYTMYSKDDQFIFRSRFYRLMKQVFKEYQLKLKLIPFDFPDDAGFKSDWVPPGIFISH